MKCVHTVIILGIFFCLPANMHPANECGILVQLVWRIDNFIVRPIYAAYLNKTRFHVHDNYAIEHAKAAQALG